MVTWNSLTAARENGGVDNGGKKGKGLVKEHVWMTHGHEQLGGDWLGVGGTGQRRAMGEIGTTVIEQ